MEKISIIFNKSDVELFRLIIVGNDDAQGFTTIVFNTDGTFNVISHEELDNISILSTKFEKVINYARHIYERKINSSSEDYNVELKHNLQYELVEAVAEFAGHHYIIVSGIEESTLFRLNDIDYTKYTVYKNSEHRLYEMMLVKVNENITSKTYITVCKNGNVCITSTRSGVNLPLMGTDQFIGDKAFLDMSPEDKVKYIREFGNLLSKRFDVVLED